MIKMKYLLVVQIRVSLKEKNSKILCEGMAENKLF